VTIRSFGNVGAEAPLPAFVVAPTGYAKVWKHANLVAGQVGALGMCPTGFCF
jgi:hypothetical protein